MSVTASPGLKWSPPAALTSGWTLAGLAGVVGFLSVVSPGMAIALIALPVALAVLSRPYLVVLALVAFMPFEEFVLKFLPVSDLVYSGSRFASELVIYTAFLVVVLHRAIRGEPLRRTPVDLPILLLLGVIVISGLFNRSPLLGSLVNVRPFFRYIVLFYLVVNLPLNERQIARLVRVILIAGVIQLAVGAMQLAGVREIFVPRESVLQVGEFSRTYTLLERGREIGSLFGTLSDTVIFGVFMVIVLALYLARHRHLTPISTLVTFLLFLAVAWSYSRAATLAAVLVLIAWYHSRHRLRRTIAIAALTGLVLLAAIFLTGPDSYVNQREARQNVLVNVTAIFSPEYVEVAKKQRLGALIGNLPTVLLNRPLLGYGPDQQTAIDRLNASQSSFLLKIWTVKGFKDVYWVALIVFYGLPGVALVIALLWRLYRSAGEISRTAAGAPIRHVAYAMRYLVIATAFLLFFNRALEFRPYGFFFWLLAGLMFSGIWSEQIRRTGLVRAAPREARS